VDDGEATDTNFTVLGLTRSGLEPTIYRTQGEHANHYTTDEPTIYRTQGEHANHCTTDEPTIYRTQGEHANHYTTYVVNINKSDCPCLKGTYTIPSPSTYLFSNYFPSWPINFKNKKSA
jgi:hypothetical protein